MKLLHALDGNDRCTGSADLGAHLVEHVGEVDNLGLARGVVDNGLPLSLDRSHDEVLGGSDACELERHRITHEALAGIGIDVTVVGIELHTQRLEAQDVHIDLSRTEVAAAGHGDLRLAEAAQEGTHDGRRRTHLGNKVVRCLPGRHL